MSMNRLIKEIEKLDNNGAVMFKLENGRVTTISPLLQCQTVEEMVQQLTDVRNAINMLITDIISRGRMN